MNPSIIRWAQSIAERKPSARFARLDQFAVRHGYPSWEDDMRHYLFCEEMNDAALTLCAYILSKAGEPIPLLRRLNDTQLAGEYVKTVQAMYALWDVDRPKAIVKDCLADIYEAELRRRGRGIPILMLESHRRPYAVACE